MQGETIADRAGATLWGGWVVWWTGQAPSVPSGRQWQGSQSSQGASELGFPRPALWQMQSEAAGRAGEPSGQGEEAPPEGSGGHHPLVQTDARGPAGQVMGQHLDGQPCAVGGEAARGEMVEADAVLEVSDGILDLGVAAMVGLQFQGFPVPVGDEAVIAVAGEEGRFHRAPQPLSGTLSVYGPFPSRLIFTRVPAAPGELKSVQLATLVGVEDRRLPYPQRLLQCIDAEVGLHFSTGQ